ncbi:hypothetical protein ACHAWF_002127 [Thalassiosira exigua]
MHFGAKRLWALALFVSIAGLIWDHGHLNSSQTAIKLDAYMESGVPPLPPPRDAYFWEQNKSSCVHVDNICSWKDGWFYAPSRWLQPVHQPTATLKVNKRDIVKTHGYDLIEDRRIKFSVSSRSNELYNATVCSFSDTPYHIIVQSAYSDMMGEFYSRAILPLNRWFQDFPLRSKDQIQMYIHVLDERKQKLFEGHRLLLGGLRNNNKFSSFLSLMPNKTCRCYTKLIFCGYNVEHLNVHTNTSLGVDSDTKTVFTPRSTIANPKVDCFSKRGPNDLRNGYCPAYRRLRKDLINIYSEKDPMLDKKIRLSRQHILLSKGWMSNASDIEEWKFVGFAHRKSRRRWLNIEDHIAMCNENFERNKIVCVKIDVETAKSPDDQLLMHRSLHALIGVHGAQLTQGVLLQSHGYILELLPWVPFYLWGSWVATTHTPTPLGIIFHGTDLNHAGYPLDRESVPLCLHIDRSDKEEERRCLMNKTSGVIEKFRWADRDFNVPLNVTTDFISSFLLKDNDLICDNMETRAKNKRFVLYNALCKQNTNSTYGTRHYYWERDISQPKNVHEH